MDQYFIILSSTPLIECTSVEWDFPRWHHNMLIKSLFYAMVDSSLVNLFVSFKVKIPVGSFDLVFACLACAR